MESSGWQVDFFSRMSGLIVPTAIASTVNASKTPGVCGFLPLTKVA